MSDEPAEAQVAESEADAPASAEQVRRRRRRAAPRSPRTEAPTPDASDPSDSSDPGESPTERADGGSATDDGQAGASVRRRTRRPAADAVPVDAVPADAVPADAVPVDAGPADAVPADAVPADAVPVDAGPVDAARTDAVPADAGPADAAGTDGAAGSGDPPDAASTGPAGPRDAAGVDGESVSSSGGTERDDAPPPPPPMPPRPPGRPKIGDTRPAPPAAADDGGDGEGARQGSGRRRRRRGRGKGGSRGGQDGQTDQDARSARQGAGAAGGEGSRRGRSRGARGQQDPEPVGALSVDEPLEIDEESLQRRRGRERKGRPVGRYLMAVHVEHDVTHIAIVEGRNLIEYYVSRPSDGVSEIHGNIYMGKVQNVLPGMEAAFVDIGTPKNAVLYRGDVSFDKDDLDDDVRTAPTPSAKGRRGGRRRRLAGDAPRIEELLRAKQQIVCQVTKNPIAHKGARLTTEVSLPGRFVVFVPDADTTGISKRLPDAERKRLRGILDRVRPQGHGVIVRTAAEDVTEAEIARDVQRLVDQWTQIQQLAAKANRPTLLFREPDMAVRVIREEFNKDYRGIVMDDPTLYEQVKGYMAAVTPALADRIELYDPAVEGIDLFERHHVSEQLRKAVDRKVWLPSGGSLIIEHTEALTVIDVNTGKNVGRSSLEETVYRNNLEAATEIARQLRLRDIGGIIVIDFIDMEVESNRKDVIGTFREALARDKTRTQVSDISDLGLVEMTRKRIGEGLIESVSRQCDVCAGRGVVLDEAALGG